MMDRAFYTFRARYDTDRCADWWRYSGLMAAISSAAIFRCVNFFSRLNFHSNAQQQLHEVRIISSCRVSTNFLCHITVSWTLVSARILALVLQLYERNKLKLELNNFRVSIFLPMFQWIRLSASFFYRATLCQRGICCRRVCHTPVLYRNG